MAGFCVLDDELLTFELEGAEDEGVTGTTIVVDPGFELETAVLEVPG